MDCSLNWNYIHWPGEKPSYKNKKKLSMDLVHDRGSMDPVHEPGPKRGSTDPWSMFCPHPLVSGPHAHPLGSDAQQLSYRRLVGTWAIRRWLETNVLDVIGVECWWTEIKKCHSEFVSLVNRILMFVLSVAEMTQKREIWVLLTRIEPMTNFQNKKYLVIHFSFPSTGKTSDYNNVNHFYSC